MSDSARREVEAFQELELLVRRLKDEAASFRRRALQAESRLREVAEAGDGAASLSVRERLAELEQENAALRSLLEAATARTKGMLDRVHFLRQQVQSEAR
jgi:cytochrome c556